MEKSSPLVKTWMHPFAVKHCIEASCLCTMLHFAKNGKSNSLRKPDRWLGTQPLFLVFSQKHLPHKDKVISPLIRGNCYIGITSTNVALNYRDLLLSVMFSQSLSVEMVCG